MWKGLKAGGKKKYQKMQADAKITYENQMRAGGYQTSAVKKEAKWSAKMKDEYGGVGPGLLTNVDDNLDDLKGGFGKNREANKIRQVKQKLKTLFEANKSKNRKYKYVANYDATTNGQNSPTPWHFYDSDNNYEKITDLEEYRKLHLLLLRNEEVGLFLEVIGDIFGEYRIK